MYVIKEMRLNKFQHCPVPSAKELYKKFGESKPLYPSKQTAESIHDTVPIGTSKTKLLSLAKDIAEKAAEFKANPEQTKPLERRDPR